MKTHHAITLLIALLISLASAPASAATVCAPAHPVHSNDLEAQLLSDFGSTLWVLEQDQRQCDFARHECGRWQGPHDYLELAVSEQGKMARYGFSEPSAGATRAQVARGHLGLLHLFRPVVFAQPGHEQIGDLGKRMTRNFTLQVGDHEYLFNIWQIKPSPGTELQMKSDLSEACIHY